MYVCPHFNQFCIFVGPMEKATYSQISEQQKEDRQKPSRGPEKQETKNGFDP